MLNKLAKRGVVVFAALFVLIAVSECSFLQRDYHERIMRGSILKQTGDQYYLCIGKRDGAQVGQMLDVYRFKEAMPAMSAGDVPVFSKDMTGKITITEVIHEHYAKAKLLSGDVRKGDVAEMAWTK